MQDLSDNDLVKRYLSGDAEALDAIVQRYFKQIFFFSKTYVKNDLEAEDITQETFIKVWKNLKKFDPERKFKTWVFQIAKNTCIDFLRKHKNLLSAEDLNEETMSAEMENLADKSPMPESQLDAQALRLLLDKALAKLPLAQSRAVSLHLLHEMTFQEIAETLGEPINTIKSRYRRALLAIRDQLETPGDA